MGLTARFDIEISIALLEQMHNRSLETSESLNDIAAKAIAAFLNNNNCGSLPPIEMALSTEQCFDLERMRRELPSMSEDHAKSLLMDMAKIVMTKDNVLRGFFKR